jgi:transcription elongation factor Elf1
MTVKHKRNSSRRKQSRDSAGKARGGATFTCPRCDNRSRVLRTGMPSPGLVKRQRECLSCGHVFDTKEQTA